MLHVSFQSVLRFGVIVVGGFDSNPCPCGVIIKPNRFGPFSLCFVSSAFVEVPNYLLCDGYLIYVVDGFYRVWSVE